MAGPIDRKGNVHGDDGQFVSIGTLFERERGEHALDHDRERSTAKDTAQRLEREVEETARRLERAVEETAVRIENAVRVALEAVAQTAAVHAEAHSREHVAHERIHGVEKQQLDKAEASMNKRLEGMNEFRDALSDQTKNAVSRELFDATIKPLTEFRARAMGAAAVLALCAGAVGAFIVKAFGG